MRIASLGKRAWDNAVVVMLVAVIGYSLLPLLIDLWTLPGSVALFTGIWTLAFAATSTVAATLWGGKPS